MGLESAADMYIPKPFSIIEFKSNVKALFRRIDIARRDGIETKEVMHFDALAIYTFNRSVHIKGVRINLTPKEFELLVLLASHPGRSFDRDELLRLVWGYEYFGYEHTVNSHINRLRAKIESQMSDPKYILTTWGVGYRFVEK